MSKPMQIFVGVALVAILAMSAYQTYVIASVVNAFQNFGTAFDEASEGGLVGESAGDQAACVTVQGGAQLESASVDSAYAQADVGSDVEAALLAYQDNPSGQTEQQVRDACAAFGG